MDAVPVRPDSRDSFHVEFDVPDLITNRKRIYRMTDGKRRELEQICGYTFRNADLLKQAMSHTSYANETGAGHGGSNERLEFLGDAVLELISSEFLCMYYPEMTEGELTRLRASLVCEPTLAFDAREMGLPEYLLLGKGEERTGGRMRDSIVSDALEALIGAIYTDGGLDEARRFVQQHVMNDIEHKKLFSDSKTILQELLQKKGGETISYRLTGEKGPDHARIFTVQVLLGSRVLGEGSGRSKKAAEQNAAYQAIIRLKEQGPICI